MKYLSRIFNVCKKIVAVFSFHKSGIFLRVQFVVSIREAEYKGLQKACTERELPYSNRWSILGNL